MDGTQGNNDMLAVTERSKLHRRPQRGHRDRATVNAVLDEALVCHIGFVVDGQPIVIPSSPWRIDDWMYLHGAATSRLIRHIASGAPVCISVALIDSLILAKSALNHSNDYRSVVLFAQGEEVVDPATKSEVLLKLIDKVSPGRAAQVRPPNAKELAATGVVRMRITEGNAKVRVAPPTVSEQDEGWDVWTGHIPLVMRAGTPVPVAGSEAAPLPALPAWLGE